jgi:hypothetical protein
VPVLRAAWPDVETKKAAKKEAVLFYCEKRSYESLLEKFAFISFPRRCISARIRKETPSKQEFGDDGQHV